MSYGKRQPIQCIETGEVFNTKQEAADYYNISRGSVQDSLRDGKSHRGYTFVYASDISSFESNENERPYGEWQDVLGYEGLYQISKEGAVWSCPRIVERVSGRPNIIRGRLLNIYQDSAGYCSVALTDEFHKTTKYLLHRLVALTFIPNPANKPEVNHKDGNKANNHIDNLEWVTRYENQYHAVVNGMTPAWSKEHMKKMSDMALSVNNKPILCVTTGQVFDSCLQACKQLHLGKDAVYISIKENRPYKGYVFKEIVNV